MVSLGEIRLQSMKIREAKVLFDKLFALDPEGKHPAANRGRQLVRNFYQKLSQAQKEPTKP